MTYSQNKVAVNGAVNVTSFDFFHDSNEPKDDHHQRLWIRIHRHWRCLNAIGACHWQQQLRTQLSFTFCECFSIIVQR